MRYANVGKEQTMTEWICTECGWIGKEDKVLTAPNPFVKSETLWGCPECNIIDHFDWCCEIPGCREKVTCGTPMQGYKYRWVCREHLASIGEEREKP